MPYRRFHRYLPRCLASAFFVWALAALPFPAAGQQKPAAPPPPVRVAPVVKETVSEQVTLIGSVEAVSESTVAAEVSGKVEHLAVHEGDYVQKGALLVRLNATELKLRLKGAAAAIEQVKSNLRLARKDLARYDRLTKSNSVAESRYDQAINTEEALAQELVRLEADAARLRYDLRRKEVVAPFSGYVAAEHAQVGEWIQPGGPVVTLVDLSKVQVTVDVPERYISQLTADSRVTVPVQVRSFSEERRLGKLSAILPVGNTSARTLPVRVDLENPGHRIKGGMEAAVTFGLADQKDALLVPKDAVVTAGNDRMVYVIMDNKALPVMVVVQGYYDGSAAVEGSLSPGTPVVIRGNERLRPGQPVQVVEGPDIK
jgi:RND family efflux transporter MFP subunit